MEKKEQYAPTFIDGYKKSVETLSDKIIHGRVEWLGVDAVKEFIRELKEGRVTHCNYLGMSGDEMMIVISVKEFNELAGDKLI